MSTTMITLTHAYDMPWIGMGTAGGWTNVSDALNDSGINNKVIQVGAWDDKGNRVPGILVNRNADTHEILGVTSDRYGVVQNRDAFSLLDPFCSAGGIIEAAGVTNDGMYFMVTRIPSMAFGFNGDPFDLYVCAMNSFNTKYPLALIITPIRVSCQNMFRKLMRRGDTALLIKHGTLAHDRILSASAAASLLLSYTSEFQDSLAVLDGQVKIEPDVERFAELMLPLVPETPERPRAKFSNERIRAQRTEFMESYYYASNNEDYWGTSLGIINAYYDWVTHHVPSRASSNFEELRFGRLMSGEAVSRKLITSL